MSTEFHVYRSCYINKDVVHSFSLSQHGSTGVVTLVVGLLSNVSNQLSTCFSAVLSVFSVFCSKHVLVRMGKFRSKLKGQTKGKRWLKGQSSSSNPETTKYRDQARSRFFQPNLGIF